ncbi:MAG TPA: TonB family protein [Candidatus Acidoferrales bacterium]|nr:TonB family protein [Candidatus Acidoferrales bacterium]
MKRFPAIASSLFVLSALVAAPPARAQYSTEFTPAKLVKQGTTSQSVAGSGTVVVQVQVNADGSHKAIKVIHSTNAGDNAAAMEIAQNSSYRPAHKGATPVTAFYDFTLKFNGKSVAQSTEQGGSIASMSPEAEKIASLIKAKQYAQAKSQAQAALISSPGDASLREMLGIAAYDDNDPQTAAQAFDHVPSVGKQYQPIAAASFAQAAVAMSQTNPEQSLAYAQKAYAMTPDTNTRFALGVAQLGNKQNADALATLKGVREAAMSDPKTSTADKVHIDSELLSAYLANNDTQGAATIAAEIKRLDPTSTIPGRVVGNQMLQAGVDAATAKNYDEAIKDFDNAASQGDPEVAVTAYDQAAFTVARMDHPDYKRMQSYADKALAIKPDDAAANFAEGVAIVGSGGDKTKALASLQKADALAKQQGNETLALNIENFIKQQKLGPTGP